MADFCNECTKKMFGENVKPDIDVIKIGEESAPGGEGLRVLCEGCGLSYIYKSESGVVLVAGTIEVNEEGFMKLMTYEEYIAEYEKKRIK